MKNKIFSVLATIALIISLGFTIMGYVYFTDIGGQVENAGEVVVDTFGLMFLVTFLCLGGIISLVGLIFSTLNLRCYNKGIKRYSLVISILLFGTFIASVLKLFVFL